MCNFKSDSHSECLLHLPGLWVVMVDRFQAHGHSVNGCQWLAGSDRCLVTVSDDKTARLWVSLLATSGAGRSAQESHKLGGGGAILTHPHTVL